MREVMPNNEFNEGFRVYVDEYSPRIGDIGSITANQLSGEYLSGLKGVIDELQRSVNEPFIGKNNPQAFGLIQEAVTASSFNVDAYAKQTGEFAWRVGSNQLGSVDVATSWGEDYGLKYYKSAYGSMYAQSLSIEHEYLSYLREFKKNHPGVEPPSPQEYLVSNGLDPNTDMSQALYLDQSLLCPPEQIPEILARTAKKIEELSKVGDTTGTLERLINLREQLTGQIKSPKGAESLKVTYQQAQDIAALAKEGKFDPKEYGITVASKANQTLIWKNAALAGLNAAWLSALLKSAPVIVDTFKYAIEEGYVSADDIRELGTSVGEGFSEGFLRGMIAAAVSTLAMEGKLGKTLQRIALSKESSSLIGVMVVLCFQTIKDVYSYSRGSITKEELGYRIDQSLVITSFSVAGGLTGQMVLPFIPVVSYMLGSMVGSILGGIVFEAKERFIIGLAVTKGYSFWGLVEQDYHMPKDLAERLGYATFDYADFNYEVFNYAGFEYAKYDYAVFDYERLAISYPERGLIGIRKVAYKK